MVAFVLINIFSLTVQQIINYFTNKMKARPHPLQARKNANDLLSCQKDLAISYLDQFESSAYHEVSREQTKNTLKEITDKYGFLWDERGRLISKNRAFDNQKPKSPHSPFAASKSQLSKAQNNKENRNVASFQQNEQLKSQICSINQKINEIVNKYHPASSYEKKPEDFCQCAHRNRLLTEEDSIQSPYFRDQHRFNVPVSRSKSSNYLLKHAIRPNEDEVKARPRPAVLKFNSPETKKIDTQIDRLNKRIQLCEKQKERLDINFKKFEIGSRLKTPEKSVNAEQNDDLILNPSLQKYATSKKPKQVCELVPCQDLVKTKEKKRVKDQEQLEKRFELSTEVPIMPLNLREIQPGIKKAAALKKIEKNGLISKFCRQIELDEEFRNAKLWFESNQDPHKWGIIADKLAVEGTQYKYRELVEKFSCVAEEHNPFFSVKNNFESYASLLSVYKEHERHWKQQIQNQFSLEQLELQEFTALELDVEQKGGVRVEDFVRYINMRTKNFYRTRDLLLLFQRFAGKQKREVHFSRILTSLIP